jgi:hypothetical protein
MTAPLQPTMDSLLSLSRGERELLALLLRSRCFKAARGGYRCAGKLVTQKAADRLVAAGAARTAVGPAGAMELVATGAGKAVHAVLQARKQK